MPIQFIKSTKTNDYRSNHPSYSTVVEQKSSRLRHPPVVPGYELVQWLESQDIDVMLPVDTRRWWDYGIDLFICGAPVDLKGFGLREYDKTYTWDSNFHRGRPRPVYKDTQTEWFIHPTEGPPSEWLVGHVNDLRTSMYGHPPYYPKDKVMTVDKLAQDVFTSPSF